MVKSMHSASFHDRVAAVLMAAAAAGVFVPLAHAQCGGQWLPGPGYQGQPNQNSNAILNWDPDGAGPEEPLVLVGGSSNTADGAPQEYLASTWNPRTGEWRGLRGPYRGIPRALIVDSNGNIIAGGDFFTDSHSPPQLTSTVLRWTGEWTPVGSGLESLGTGVTDFAFAPNGDLLAAGYFRGPTGSGINGLARWNGTTWSAVGNPMMSDITRVAVMPSGDVLVSGKLLTSGWTLGRWNGSTWTYFPALLSQKITRIRMLPSGQALCAMLAWGPQMFNPATNTFALLGSSYVGGNLLDAFQSSTGDIIAAGQFSVARVGNTPIFVHGIAKWNGATWSSLDGDQLIADTQLSAVELTNGDFVTNFPFGANAPYSNYSYLGWLHNNTWRAMGTDAGYVTTLFQLHNGDIVAIGSPSLEGQTYNRIERWDGRRWNAMGAGLTTDVFYTTFNQGACVLANDDFVIGRPARLSDGTATVGVSRWDGTTWHAMGSGLTGTVSGILQRPNGDVLAGGTISGSGSTPIQSVARWDGTSWSQFAIPFGSGSAVNGILESAQGEVIAFGTLVIPGDSAIHRIAKWDGQQWTPMEPAWNTGAVSDMALLPDGTLVAAGTFFSNISSTVPKYLARWDGTQWLSFPNPPNVAISHLILRPDGGLVISQSGMTVGPQPLHNNAIWKNNQWMPLDIPVGPDTTFSQYFDGPGGEVFIGGYFTGVNGVPSRGFARYIPPGDYAPPIILQQPQPASVPCKGIATFEVNADGAALSYQWQIETAAGSGEFSSIAGGPTLDLDDARGVHSTTLIISPVSPEFSGRRVRVLVSNGCNQLASEAAPLTVTGPAHIIAQPTSVDSQIGSTASVGVIAESIETSTFTWERNSGASWVSLQDGPLTITGQTWGIIAGTQSPTLMLTPDTTALAIGPISVRARIANPCGSTLSEPVSVSVSGCDPDLNQDGVTDQGDVDYLINAIAGGGNPNNTDPDFNHDGAADQGDVDALINVVAGGPCP